MFAKLIQNLAACYDWLDSEAQRDRLERYTVRLAAVGFLFHLALIAMVQYFPQFGSGVLGDLDGNFLHAVYTPFSFILFYEVLLLVLALPKSHTSSIGKQYEIVSLIVIRRVFKDIGEFRDPEAWVTQKDAALSVVLDMAAAVVMFMLVTAFYQMRKSVVRSLPHRELGKFVMTKKAVAVVLSVVLSLLAAFNLLKWALPLVVAGDVGPGETSDLDAFFFPEFFEFMIFEDVFLLIVSLSFYERYEYVIRNAGFVISTILLRISLSTPKPYDLAVGLVAMFYGLCVLTVFSYFTRMNAASDSSQENNPLSRDSLISERNSYPETRADWSQQPCSTGGDSSTPY